MRQFNAIRQEEDHAEEQEKERCEGDKIGQGRGATAVDQEEKANDEQEKQEVQPSSAIVFHTDLILLKHMPYVNKNMPYALLKLQFLSWIECSHCQACAQAKYI
ncbi:unnamed protein product [Durusdinium trenchii]|uniref:Uncharacterized protein n=2 Tax=Durusdinium trenchii TaxID=1381693 RepID=A0ABP0RM07_9DINO